MAKLAFLGLGQMGMPMATRLAQADHDLTVWNRSPGRTDDLASWGARVAATPAGAVTEVEAAITMLSDPRAVEEVLFGADGAAAEMAPGTTLIEMSTIGPAAVRRIAERLPDGAQMLDAPVQGSVPQATDGSLRIHVGGDEALFRRWRPVLEVMGRPRRYGDLGAGASMKLVMNSTLGAAACALAEALALGDALGLDEQAMFDLLVDSPVGRIAESARERVETGSFGARFRLALARKDLGLVIDAAEMARADLRLARAAFEWMSAAEEAGLGGLDYTAIVTHIRGRGLPHGTEA